MCAMLIGVFAGNPERLTTKVAVAAVTFPAPSFVVTIVTVAVPLPAASPPTIAGTSFEGDSAAVKVGFVGVVVAAVDELPQPDTRTPRATKRRARRYIEPTPFAGTRSVEFPGQVEPEGQVLRHATVRQLTIGRPGAVAEDEGEHVRAHTLFDGKRVLGGSDHETAGTRRSLEDEVRRLPQASAAAEADEPGVGCGCAAGAGVVHPHRR